MFTQYAYAATVQIPAGTGVPGCEQTNQCFIPPYVTVDVGETVTWTNDDNAAHTVTSNDGSFDSSLFMAGHTFSHTFDEPGVYEYICMVHPWMVGTVLVDLGISIQPTVFPTITVSTDRTLYNEGDTIRISGKVSDILENTVVSLSVYSPQGLRVAIDQPHVSYSRSYSTELIAGGLMQDEGTYTVKVLYGSESTSDSTTFYFVGTTTTPPTLPPTSPNTVFIPAGSAVPGCERTNECFIPAEIIVNVGDTVKWENKDSAAHTVTSGYAGDGPDGNFDSNMLMSGQTFYHTFRTSGEYPYFDMLHPWQAGVVIVESAPTPTPTPTPIFDITPPKILKPSDITIDATDSTGARVTYDVLAIDDVDQIIDPSCRPYSGSLFPIGDTTVTCSATDSAGNSARQVSFIVTVNAPGLLIPDWIKEVAAFWCDDKIDDSSFIEGIQYLIDNDIIIVSATSSGAGGSQTIPSWVKNNACWWSMNLISDEDFAGGLEYLIGQGIIRV